MKVFRNKLALAAIGLILTNTFWAINAVSARFFRGDISAFDLNFYRWLGAFMVLSAVVLPQLKKDFRVLFRYRFQFLVLGVLGVSYFNFALYLAAQTTTAMNIGLFNSLGPLMTILLSSLLLSDNLTRSNLAGMLLAFCGTTVVLTQGQLNFLLNMSFKMGDLVMLSAAFAWGLYTVLLRKWAINCHPLSLLWGTIAAGLLVILPFKLILAPQLGFANPAILGLITYTAIFPAILAYLFWGYGVRQLGASVGSMSLYLNPCIIVLLSYLFLDDQLGIFHAIGGLMIFTGLAVVFIPKLIRQHGHTEME